MSINKIDPIYRNIPSDRVKRRSAMKMAVSLQQHPTSLFIKASQITIFDVNNAYSSI